MISPHRCVSVSSLLFRAASPPSDLSNTLQMNPSDRRRPGLFDSVRKHGERKEKVLDEASAGSIEPPHN